MPRKKKQETFSDPLLTDTATINLGPSEDLPTQSSLQIGNWNFVLVHRHDEWIMQKWGNFCSKLVSYVTVRAADEKPVRWYHVKLYNFCYEQYDKYGDYYRVLDNSFGEANDDDIYEVR